MQKKHPKVYKNNKHPLSTLSDPPPPSWAYPLFEINDIHIKKFFIHMQGPPIAYPYLGTPPPYPQNVDNIPFYFTNPSLRGLTTWANGP